MIASTKLAMLDILKCYLRKDSTVFKRAIVYEGLLFDGTGASWLGGKGAMAHPCCCCCDLVYIDLYLITFFSNQLYTCGRVAYTVFVR